MAARPIERRIVTVLFADLVGFTSLSERLDAEDVTLVQDAYFAAVREAVARHGGVLEKFVGDAVLAAFGVARARDDDAERAVRAGLALVAAVDRLGAQLGLAAGELRLRVGVNTGEAVVGEATSERGPVTGDTVNVAARLQAAAAPGTVVVGELTALAVADAVALEPLQPLELKGKAEPVRAQTVVDVFPERSRERALGALRAPTLGRDVEVARLLEVVGRRTRVLVVAPPGVGKTRLLGELAAAAEGLGARVLRARSRPDVLAPFEPVGQLLSSAGDPSTLAAALAESGVGAGRAAVVAAAAESAVTLSPDGPAGSDGAAEDRERLFAAWVEALDALARGAPALWLLEDVHWASADLLAFLAAAGESGGAHAVVATARPSLLESAARWCAEAELLELRPLAPADATELVRALAGAALPDDLVARIVERSDGTPLFIEELLRLWASAGVLVPDGNAWRLAADAADVPLPPTVHAIYAGQLDDLPPSARAAAQHGAVAGRRFPLGALRSFGLEDAEEGVGALAARAFVAGPDADPLLGDSYAFRHALLRDAGYASLARGDRALLHYRLARWLESLGTGAASALAEVTARHYAAALDALPALAPGVDDVTRDELAALAAERFERAADVAFSLAAWATAAVLARRALELGEGDAPVVRARRLQRLGEATANAEGMDAARPLLEEAVAAYRAAGPDPGAWRGLASAAVALGMLLRAQTRFDAAGELADSLLGEVGDSAVARGELLVMRGLSALNARDDADAARADAREALVLAREARDPGLELSALELVAQADAESGVVDEEAWREVERLARAAGRWEKVGSAIRVRAGLVLDDRPDETLVTVEEAAALAEAHGLVEHQAWCDYLRAEAHFCRGDWDEALACGLRAIDLGERHGFHRVIVRSWFVLLPLAVMRGRGDLVAQAYPRFAARAGEEPDSPFARVVATAAHLRFAAAGLEEPFVPELEPRLPSFDLDPGGPSWLTSVETVIDAWIGAGRLDDAERALDGMRARLASPAVSDLARASEALLRARVHAARGDAAAAGEEARRALAFVAGAAGSWLRLQAIEVLRAGGECPPELAAEAERLAERLGVRVAA